MLDEGQEIILYGSGKRCMQIFPLLKQAQLIIKAIVDNDAMKWRTVEDNIAITAPSSIKEWGRTALCITVADPDEQRKIRNVLANEYGYDLVCEISYDDLVMNVVLLIRKERLKRIDYIKKEAHVVFDCISGLGLGGIEEWTKELCAELLKEGFDNVRIFTDMGKYQVPDILLNAVDRVLDRNLHYNKAEMIGRIMDYLINLMPLTVVTSKPDWFLEAAAYLKKFAPDSIRIITVIHNGEEHIYRLYDRYRDYTDIYIAVSEDIRNDFIHRGMAKEKIYSITCPVFCDEVLDRSYSVDSGSPIRVGYAGRIVVRQKRMDLMLKVIERLEQRKVNYVLEIAGDGPYREEMENNIINNGWDRHVHFLGVLDRSAIPDFWKRQDIYVNVSDNEGRSISQLEAMAGGAVPVATCTSGTREDICSGMNGYLLDIGDYAGIAEKIEYLAVQRRMLPEFGYRAHKVIYPKCRRQTHAEFWKEMLRNETRDLIKSHTWEDFDNAVGAKKLFLFGIGAGARYFFRTYGNVYQAEGVLDNDEYWHGFKVGDIMIEAFGSVNENVEIMPVSRLGTYRPEDILVLITSSKYCKDMGRQLADMGIKDYYVMSVMGENKRKYHMEVVANTDFYTNAKEEYARFCYRYPIQSNKIVFKSFGTYSDHGKYITEQLLKSDADLDIVWVLTNLKEKVPDGIRKVWSKNWKKYIYEMETAHIWIINTMLPPYIIKRDGQVYIHTKHWASITLKKFYLDAPTVADVETDAEDWRRNGKYMDYIFTGSRFDSESCRRGFGFEKKTVEVGSARTDAMFKGKLCRQKVTEVCHLEETGKILLYAPTYRYSRDTCGAHKVQTPNIDLDFELARKALTAKFGGTWYILLRLHPSVAGESGKIHMQSYVLDVSTYPDSEELASACDVMISDYSSIMFEPAFVKKPVFLLATDLEEYIRYDYDFLIDYNTLPFPIAKTNSELYQNIMEFDHLKYEKEVTHFMKQYGVCEDGQAGVRAAKFIVGLVDKGKEETTFDKIL